MHSNNIIAPIRFAIVGCGRIAQRHAQEINNVGRLVAVCDIIEDRANNTAAAFDSVPFYSIQSLFSSGIVIDVIVICTPNGIHASQALLAFEHGCHVLVEKPMALHASDCTRMINAAIAAGKQLFLVMQNRFNPPVLAVKKALDEKAFGAISSIQLSCLWNRGKEYYTNSWKGSMDMDGGTLYTQFSHFIDILYWMFGEVENIQAITANRQHGKTLSFEDCGSVNLLFKSGVIGSVHFSVNSFAANREGALTILGDKGIAKIGGSYLNTIEYSAFKDYTLDLREESRAANDYGHYQGSMSNHDKVYRSIVSALLESGTYYTEPLDGWHTINIIERIYAAALQA